MENRISIINLAVEKIKQLPAEVEFRIIDYIENKSEFDTRELFEITKEIIKKLNEAQIKYVEKIPEADLGLPFNIPRIRKQDIYNLE